MKVRLSVLSFAIPALLTASLIAQDSQGIQTSQDSQASQDAQSDRAMSSEIQRLRPNLGATDVTRVVRGFRIAPVRLNLARKDFVLVGLGSYFVNAAGGCNDCHTSPSYAAGGDPFKGEPKRVNAANYLAGGAPFGPFTSRNITPDPASGLPANLTYEKFRQSMRTGVDQKRAHPDVSLLLQVMPWPVYQDLTERDLRSIYEYLRAIPHAEPAPPPPTGR
jgi:hypothetical protein